MCVIRDGQPRWVPSVEVVRGDILATCSNVPSPPSNTTVANELVELLAWQITEGFENIETSATSITQDDVATLVRLLSLFHTLHPESQSGHLRTPQGRCTYIDICHAPYRKRLEALGYVWGMKSAQKALPVSFLSLSDEQLCLLLRCAFEAEGHAGPTHIEFPTASVVLATQVEYMLLRFGVRCARHVAHKAATNGTGIKRPYVRLFISGEDAVTFTTKIGFLSTRKTAVQYGVRGNNPNFGVPVQWVGTRLAALGLTAKTLRLNNAGKSPTAARSTAEDLHARLVWLASDKALAHYRRQVCTLGGTAKRFAMRTLAAIEAGRAVITKTAEDLQRLLTQPLRYEPVVETAKGTYGGFVYDVSVDSDNYDHQNYVGGTGGLILHNTLTSIAAGDALDEPLEAIVPAPLVPNYQKEMIKHTGGIPEGARVRSYERALKDRDVRKDGLAVMDEAHKARNADTGIAKHIAGEVAKAKDRLLLTGTPVYNQAEDLAILLNTAAGRKMLPDDPKLFRQTFVGTKTIQAPLWDRLKGQLLGHPVDNVTVPALVNRQRLVDAATGYVDVHAGGGEGFPRRIDELHEVPLGAKQNDFYKFHEGSMPWYLRAKIRAGLPLDKSESKDLNAFQGALRQVSNTARPYDPSMTDEQEIKDSNKIQMVLKHLTEMRAKNPNHRGVIYSNYLDSGVLPVSRALKQQGIDHHVFTGSASPTQRRTMIEDYNAGRVPLLLLSGAGSEGLDLKGTRSIQLMEPHWNPSRIDQVIGRGIRYKSHEHLPEEEREVKVMRYHSKLPEDLIDKASFLIGMKPKKSIEQYLTHMSEQKGILAKDIAGALQEASDRGPLKRPLWQKLSAENSTFDDVVKAMDDVTIIQQKRKKLLRYHHPSGVTLDSEFNPSFATEQLHEKFDGKPLLMAQQMQDDLLNMGYASLGQVAKANEKKQIQRASQGLMWGTLAGTFAGIPGAPALTLSAVNRVGASHPRLAQAAAFPLMLASSVGAPILGGTLGWHIGKATYKPMGIEDMVASNKHPLLIPPKAVKQRVKLEVKDK